MGRFFVDTGDGIHFLDNEEEAKAEAEKALAFWREKSVSDGEWDEQAERVCWGEIRQESVPNYEGPFCDYVLKAV